MEMNLPIKQGERPLFKALEIVESIYRDYRRSGDVYETTKSEYIIQTVAKLYVFADLIRVREYKGIRNNSYDLFKILEELPLFFKVEQVKEWEIEKKWNNTKFIPYKNVLLEYETSFETLTPSSLYQAKSQNNINIWQQWLIKTPIKDVIETLEYSAQSLLEWNNKRKQKTHLEKNLDSLSKYISLNKKDTKNWFFLQVLGKENNDFWNLFLRENQDNDAVSKLINIWEKSLNLEINSLNSLLYEDSTLVELGFYSQVKEKANDWKQYWSLLEKFDIPYMNTRLINQKNILSLFLKEVQMKDALPLEMFAYMKGLKENIHLINQLKKGKVLIHGKNLSGKKSLVHSILKLLGYKGFTINHKEHQSNEAKNKLHELNLADRLLSKFEKSALIIENSEDNYDLKSKNKIKLNNSLQFWTVSNIKEVDANFLQTFDIILEIEPPPLKQRIQLSKFFFEDESIAIRIAQSLKQPFEIIRIGKLCHLAQDWSWKHITLLMSNFNSITNIEDEKIDLNRLDNEDDIIPLVGYPDLKELLNKLVNFYKNPNEYMKMGAKADKGILLVGPPGTGKTHFARNLSKIVNLPIFAPDTSVLASNLEGINNMFIELKKHSPCILFLDEIDTLIANPKVFGVINLEKQKIVNTFLSNIDGIESNDGILIIGTTHRKDNFDPAAIRSGRLSKVISLNLPTEDARKEIWEVHLKNKMVDENITMEQLAQLSVGFSCADIMEASNKAAVLAVESQRKEVGIIDLQIACDETFWGYTDSNMIVNEKQKRITAYHEAGHALLAWRHGYKVQRITIRPRQNSLGATHFVGEEGVFNMSIEGIRNKLQVMLGGICAEKIIFGYYENGGIGDLKHANDLVYHALSQAGLGNEGPIHLGDPKLWSNDRRLRLEYEEKEIMEKEFAETESYLNLNQDLLKELALYLLEHKEISGSIMNYFKNKLLTTNVITKKEINKLDEQVLHKDKN